MSFRFTFDDFSVTCMADALPILYKIYKENAHLAEEIDLNSEKGTACFFGVYLHGRLDWPALVIAMRYLPSGYGFEPGALVIPETQVLFLGAGTTLLAYDLSGPSRLWIDTADFGFLRWQRHGDVVVMSAELEMKAFDLRGRKLWSRFVEPPWHYNVDEKTVRLNIMGSESTVSLLTGEEGSF